MDEKRKEKIVKFFREILNVYDFQLVIDTNKNLENVFRLSDNQKGNLNGIDNYFWELESEIGNLISPLRQKETKYKIA